MTIFKHLKRATIFIVVIAGLVASAFFYGQYRGEHAADPTITSELIGKRLENVQELTTTKYYYTNTGSFENNRNLYGWSIPLTTKKFIVSYDGTIHAGVNLKQMTIQVKDDKITIELPAPKILAHEIDEDSLQIFDERDSIFNPITIEDYAGFSIDQKKIIEEEAIEKGLLKEARKNAEMTIQTLLINDPQIAKQFTLEFKSV
ncbi:DUF4230 domain-containing protein [Atopobacter phocae]|uniref:DUF4230 domain-containing protein n=1 Tax=Atopobacter phocae TaxID=136492 RepID=UPI0004BAC51C|nr:DUF4230 domain-containing protein [Atopobacter phocae]